MYRHCHRYDFWCTNELSASGIVVLCSDQKCNKTSVKKKIDLKIKIAIFSKIEKSKSIETLKSRIVTILVKEVDGDVRFQTGCRNMCSVNVDLAMRQIPRICSLVRISNIRIPADVAATPSQLLVQTVVFTLLTPVSS